MKLSVGYICILLYMNCSSYAWSDDTIKVSILDSYDKRNSRTIRPISKINIEEGVVAKLWGYIEFKSDSTEVKPETYFFEWGFNNGQEREILDSYKTETEVLIYERSIMAVDDIYGFIKRIWSVKEGTYDLSVYKKEKGHMSLVGQAKVNARRIK